MFPNEVTEGRKIFGEDDAGLMAMSPSAINAVNVAATKQLIQDVGFNDVRIEALQAQNNYLKSNVSVNSTVMELLRAENKELKKQLDELTKKVEALISKE